MMRSVAFLKAVTSFGAVDLDGWVYGSTKRRRSDLVEVEDVSSPPRGIY